MLRGRSRYKFLKFKITKMLGVAHLSASKKPLANNTDLKFFYQTGKN